MHKSASNGGGSGSGGGQGSCDGAKRKTNVTILRAMQNHVRNQTKEKQKKMYTFGASQRELEELTK